MKNLDSARPAFAALAKALLGDGYSLKFGVHGNSMTPFLKDGDVLTFRPLAHGEPAPGDVILYLSDSEKVIVHRVIGLDRSGGQCRLLMRGDAQLVPETIALDQALGRASDLERNGKSVPLPRPSSGILAALRFRLLLLRRRLARPRSQF